MCVCVEWTDSERKGCDVPVKPVPWDVGSWECGPGGSPLGLLGEKLYKGKNIVNLV